MTLREHNVETVFSDVRSLGSSHGQSFGNTLADHMGSLACQLSPRTTQAMSGLLLCALSAFPPCGKIIPPHLVQVRQEYDLLQSVKCEQK